MSHPFLATVEQFVPYGETEQINSKSKLQTIKIEKLATTKYKLNMLANTLINKFVLGQQVMR